MRALEVRGELAASAPGEIVSCDDGAHRGRHGERQPVALRSLTTVHGAPLSPADLAAALLAAPGSAACRASTRRSPRGSPSSTRRSRRTRPSGLGAWPRSPRARVPLAESAPRARPEQRLASSRPRRCAPGSRGVRVGSLRRMRSSPPSRPISRASATPRAFDLGLSDAESARARPRARGALRRAGSRRARGRFRGDRLTAGSRGWRERLAEVRRRASFARDLIARQPSLAALREPAPRFRLPRGAWPRERSARTTALRAASSSRLAAAGGRGRLELRDRRAPARAPSRRSRASSAIFLEGLAAAPSTPLGRVSLLSAEERRRVLVEWNATARPVAGRRLRAPAVRAPGRAHARRHRRWSSAARRSATASSTRARTARAPPARARRRPGRAGRRLHRALARDDGRDARASTRPAAPTCRSTPATRTTASRSWSRTRRCPVLITQQRLLARLPQHEARVVCLDAEWPEIATRPTTPPARRRRPGEPRLRDLHLGLDRHARRA